MENLVWLYLKLVLYISYVYNYLLYSYNNGQNVTQHICVQLNLIVNSRCSTAVTWRLCYHQSFPSCCENSPLPSILSPPADGGSSLIFVFYKRLSVLTLRHWLWSLFQCWANLQNVCGIKPRTTTMSMVCYLTLYYACFQIWIRYRLLLNSTLHCTNSLYSDWLTVIICKYISGRLNNQSLILGPCGWGSGHSYILIVTSHSHRSPDDWY